MPSLHFRLPGALACLAVVSAVVSSPAAAAAGRRPNIVFILADDLGDVDVNRFAERATGVPAARQFYETPHLDRLGREGTAFAQAYACQLCSPTRAGVLTGRNSAKVGVMTATPGTVRTYYNQGLNPPPGYLAHDAIYWGDTLKIPQALLNGSTLDALPSGQPLTPHSAIREGDYKLIFDWSGRLLLYDIRRDLREGHDLVAQMPGKARELFGKLNRWLDQNVAVKYTPALNPKYDPTKEVRARAFLDQRQAMVGEAQAIRVAQSDPRLQQLLLDEN